MKSGSIHRYPLIALAAGFSLILCGLGATYIQAADSSVRETSGSNFHELALNLRQYSAAIKVDFALAAIAETASLYQQETLALKTSSGSEKLDRWARNVDSYASALQAMTASVTPSTNIGIHESEGGYIYLLIDGQPVIISGPRPAQQVQLEQTITRHFCGQYPCDSLIENYSGEGYGDVKMLPHWQFQIEPIPTCSTGDGLALVFNSRSDLLKKRDLCKQLFTELVLLVDMLVQQRSNGVLIQWHELAIHSGPDSDQALISLNDKGDTASLSMPGCAVSPALINHALPWLKSKVVGETGGQVLLVLTNTEELIAALLQETAPGKQ